jgi:2-oxoglutarate ferredoxin oxidoreductase subunit beta
MEQAIKHKGFALVDIMFPCVTFNKINTFAWFKQRARPIGPEHDPSDFEAAVKLASAELDFIPTGLIYKADRPAFEDRFAALKGEPIARLSASYTPDRVKPLFEKYK